MMHRNERQTDRQTDRERERDRQTDRQTARQAGRQADRQTDMHIYICIFVFVCLCVHICLIRSVGREAGVGARFQERPGRFEVAGAGRSHQRCHTSSGSPARLFLKVSIGSSYGFYRVPRRSK